MELTGEEIISGICENLRNQFSVQEFPVVYKDVPKQKMQLPCICVHEITEEFEITTIINSHDMNSVMEIGDNILFIENGEKAWQGNKEDIFHVDNKELNDFVFASDLFKKVKKVHQKKL